MTGDSSSPAEEIGILWERRAFKELQALPRTTQQRIVKAIDQLRERPMCGKALAGDWKGLRRLRVGNYRVIYGFDGRQILITILRIGHRREVYRN